MLPLVQPPVRTFYFFCRIVTQGADQNPGDLLSGYHAIFRRSRMASIALQHNDFVLIIIVVVKPAGPDDGVGMATRPDQTFGASFPVMNLSTLIPVLSRSVTPIVVIKLMRTGYP